MSQAPPAFTQAASQGYGEFSSTNDDDDQEQNAEDEPIPDGPQSPEPEDDENDDYGFTQTQERSYPTGVDSEPEDEQLGPDSPTPEIEEDEKPFVAKSQTRRIVQIANDSDSDENEEKPQTTQTTPSSSRNFLKQFVVRKDENKKHHKKRSNDDQHAEKETKRSKRRSRDEQQQEEEEEETSNVDDVVDNIFGKDDDEEEETNDRHELEAELADLNNEETVETEENADDDDDGEQLGTYDDDMKQDDEHEDSPKKKQSSSKHGNMLYEMDLIIEKNRERRRNNRSSKSDGENISKDLDKFVQNTIEKMRTAYEEDRIFNENQQPATAKLQLLPIVEKQVYRIDLTELFKDNGILSVLKDWLSPLPDKSLPNIKIRQSLIRMLQHFTELDSEMLKESGIGKAVMYLYKHPRETKENKIKLIKLIHDWARPIFSLDTDYKNLTREEREKRDVDQATLKRQTSSSGKSKSRNTEVDMSFLSERRSKDDDGNDDDCPRARVPRASNRDYVIRPTSKVELPEKDKEAKQKSVSRLDEVKRRQQDRKRLNRPTPIVKLSIEGNRMHL